MHRSIYVSIKAKKNPPLFISEFMQQSWSNKNAHYNKYHNEHTQAELYRAIGFEYYCFLAIKIFLFYRFEIEG